MSTRINLFHRVELSYYLNDDICLSCYECWEQTKDKPPEISNLAKVLDKYLNGQQLVSYTSRYLTKPGDNYGSIMLAISAKVQKPNGIIEHLPLVAKLPPLTSKELWNLFRPEVSSLRENAIYSYVSPSMRQLQLDSGIPETELVELFAKFYGCRISLDENATTLDRNAVLVLEDLQSRGYKAGKRHNMFDLDHIRLVLKYVASYHALPIALRKKEPLKFQENILPKFEPFGFFEEAIFEIRQMCKEVKLALGDDISKQSIDDTGTTPIKLKIIDFQTTQYASLAHDLILLLFTSVKIDILEEHLDDLLEYYYVEFINCLKTMLCDIKEYSYEKFYQEVKRIAPIQIPHAIFMSKVIMTEDSNLSDEIDIKALHSSSSPALLRKIRDIVRLSQKFGFFW